MTIQPTLSTDEVYLTETDLARHLHVSERTLQRQRLDGTGVKYVKFGRRVLYRRSDVETHLQDRTFTSTSQVDVASLNGGHHD